MARPRQTKGYSSPALPTPTLKPMATSDEKPDDLKPYSIVDSVNNLVNCKDLSDVTFVVGANKKLIYGHKMILSLGSPVFKQMFYGEFPQSSEAIEISDLTEVGFMNMLQYIYSNKIDFVLSHIHETYKSLDKYLVHNFQEKLLERIASQLDESNCCIIFDQLVKIEKECECLDVVESFIKINSSAALRSDSFLQIDLHSLLRLLNFDYLNVTEFEILAACSRWMHAKLKKSNKEPTWQNVQEEFEEIKSFIKFTDLTIEELSEVSKQAELRNILSFSEMGSLFFYLNDKTTKPTIEYRGDRRTMLSQETVSIESEKIVNATSEEYFYNYNDYYNDL